MIKFEYPLPLSKQREDFLVTHLENEVAADLLKTKALVTAHLIAVPIKGQNPIKDTFELYKSYSEILLPTGKKQVKLENMSKESLTTIKQTLKQLGKELLKKPRK